jgi:hypothetical protein
MKTVEFERVQRHSPFWGLISRTLFKCIKMHLFALSIAGSVAGKNVGAGAL